MVGGAYRKPEKFITHRSANGLLIVSVKDADGAHSETFMLALPLPVMRHSIHHIIFFNDLCTGVFSLRFCVCLSPLRCVSDSVG